MGSNPRGSVFDKNNVFARDIPKLWTFLGVPSPATPDATPTAPPGPSFLPGRRPSFSGPSCSPACILRPRGSPALISGPRARRPSFLDPGACRPSFLDPGACRPSFLDPGARRPSFLDPGARRLSFLGPEARWPSFSAFGLGSSGAWPAPTFFIFPGDSCSGRSFRSYGRAAPGARRPSFSGPGLAGSHFRAPGLGGPHFWTPGLLALIFDFWLGVVGGLAAPNFLHFAW